jgi:outer membrane biosynthesis protein TonB
VLAVWTVPGGPWKGEVDIPSRIGAEDLAGAISRQFAARGELIRACQSAAPSAAGPAIVKMKVHPDGDLTDVAVSSKLGAALNRCVETAVTGMKLDPLAADEAVAYQLSVTFTGARSPPPPGPGTQVVEGGEPGAPGSVSGALDAIEVQRVLRPARPKMAACMRAGQGALDLRFTIRADGTTKNIVSKDASGTVIDQACIKKVVAGLKFAAANDETRVVLPLSSK